MNTKSTKKVILSLGEGNTPLIRLANLESKLDWKDEIWAKCEFLNPTGSFKDRGSIVEVSQSIKLGKKGVVCASTGNMAASLAAYSAKAGIQCVVTVPKSTSRGKLKQAQICDAEIVEVNGNYDDCVKKAKRYSEENNFLLCGDYELRRLGQSTVGIELAQSGIELDAFIVPVGNGTLGCAISQGFAMYGKFPAFIGVQGKGADPIYQAWTSNSTMIRIIVPKTIASAMNVGNPLDGNITLDWIEKTNGQIFSIADGEIQTAQYLLAKEEGLFVEKSAAATVSVLEKITTKELTVVLILSGNGLKESYE